MKRSKREMNREKASDCESNTTTPVINVKKDRKEKNNENLKSSPMNSGNHVIINKAKKMKKNNIERFKSTLSSSVAERTKKKRSCNISTKKSPGNTSTPVSSSQKENESNLESTKGSPENISNDNIVTSAVTNVEQKKLKDRQKKKLMSKKKGRPLKSPHSSGKRSCESTATEDMDGKEGDVESPKGQGHADDLGSTIINEGSFSQETFRKSMVVTCPRLSVRARLRSSSGSEDSKSVTSENTEARDTLQVSMDTTSDSLCLDIKPQELDDTLQHGSMDTINDSLLLDLEPKELEDTPQHGSMDATNDSLPSDSKLLELEKTEPSSQTTTPPPSAPTTTTTLEVKRIQEEIMESTSTIENKSNKEERKRNKKKQRPRKEKKDNITLNPSDKPEDKNNSSANIEDSLEILDIGEKVAVGEKDNLESANVGEEEMHEEFPLENVRYIPVDLHDDYHGILLLKQNQIIAVHGCLQLGVIHGEVDIGGYITAGGKGESEIQYADVYSSTTSSLLYVKDQTTTATCLEEVSGKLITDLSTIFNTSSEKWIELLADIKNISSCLIVKKFYSLLPAVLKKLDNFKGFPRDPKFIPQPFEVAVLDTGAWNVVVDEILKEMLNREDDCLCSVMLCGVGNVGKSSLARYVVNRMLSEHTSIYFLDCDCGQTEFTPPSCLSLVKITKPLLGPPFSHLLTPVASYFYGHISPGETPSEYIKLIGNLFHIYYTEHHSEGPLVINTQGWMQGLGLSLLVDCIRLTSPCHIVHINSPTEKRNVPVHLSDELLQEEKGWYYDSSYKCMKSGHGCTYHHLPITEVQNYYTNLRKYKSRVSRDQSISSYFSSLYQPFLDHHVSKGKKYVDWRPPSMSALLPYVVRWRDVALHIMHEKVTSDVMLFGFNLALVGLVHVDPELIKRGDEDSEEPQFLLDQPEAEYIGFGIIRNIDPTNKLFYILTPVPKEKLERVNALLRGSAQLPMSYFLEDVDSNRPYYCADYINVASKTASSMKPRYNLKRKPSKMKAVHD